MDCSRRCPRGQSSGAPARKRPRACPPGSGCTAGACWGRFGWQGTSLSIRDQTVKALAREMGLTTRDAPMDDCTAAEADCRAQPAGGHPEVSDDLLDALVQFARWLAVPSASPTSTATGPATAAGVDPTFVALGCAGCIDRGCP